MSGDPHPKPTRRPKAATKQRRKWNAGRDSRAVVTARSGGLCELALDGCTVKATHHHHRLLRSQGGKDHEDNFLHLCERCHSAVHAHPEVSYERGWMVRGLDVKAAPLPQPTNLKETR